MTEPSPAARTAWATFPADRRSPGAARGFIAGQLGAWGHDEIAETSAVGEVALLLVSELVTNGVLHAGTAVGVAVGYDGDTLAVAVTDGVPDGIDAGPWSTPQSRGAPSGRGLRIVDALADDWGVSVHDRGKTVWFELDPERVASESR